MQAVLSTRNPVRYRRTALVTRMTAIVRVLVAQAQHFATGNGDERNHSRHQDGRSLSHSSHGSYPAHAPYYSNGLYPFFSLLKIQPSGTAFAPAKSYTFKR